MSERTQTKAWLALAKHYDEIKQDHMRDMFENDQNRFDKYSLQLNDILYDYTTNRISDETVKLLLQLADEIELPKWIEKMFQGDAINHKEDR